MPSLASVSVGVPMTVVLVWIVGVAVGHHRMDMRVTVRFTNRIIRSMVVLMMGIVDVAVLVFQGVVCVLMLMALGKVQPDPDAHQYSCRYQ